MIRKMIFSALVAIGMTSTSTAQECAPFTDNLVSGTVDLMGTSYLTDQYTAGQWEGQALLGGCVDSFSLPAYYFETVDWNDVVTTVKTHASANLNASVFAINLYTTDSVVQPSIGANALVGISFMYRNNNDIGHRMWVKDSTGTWSENATFATAMNGHIDESIFVILSDIAHGSSGTPDDTVVYRLHWDDWTDVGMAPVATSGDTWLKDTVYQHLPGLHRSRDYVGTQGATKCDELEPWLNGNPSPTGHYYCYDYSSCNYEGDFDFKPCWTNGVCSHTDPGDCPFDSIYNNGEGTYDSSTFTTLYQFRDDIREHGIVTPSGYDAEEAVATYYRLAPYSGVIAVNLGYAAMVDIVDGSLLAIDKMYNGASTDVVVTTALKNDFDSFFAAVPTFGTTANLQSRLTAMQSEIHWAEGKSRSDFCSRFTGSTTCHQ